MTDNKDMENNSNYYKEVESALTAKQEWFNKDYLPGMLENYRLIYTCVKNLNELLEKKSLVTPDPYKFEHKIVDVAVIETTPFKDGEISKVLGSRLSEYEMMLDFLCTYFHFSIENLDVTKIKSLMEFNACIDWKNVSQNGRNPNSRALAEVINNAKTNVSGVTINMISDSILKCGQQIEEINQKLSKVAEFQRELYKVRIRKDIFEHPDFNTEKAFSSPENEMAEIKRLYIKIIGKKNFYTDLIQEIINEDQAPNRADLQKAVLARLNIEAKQVKKAKAGPDPREMLMNAVFALGPISPSLGQVYTKLEENFSVFFSAKKTFGAKLAAFFRKLFGLSEPARVCMVTVINPKTETKTQRKVVADEILGEIFRKSKTYSGIFSKSVEYQKLNAASDDAVLVFLNKHIQENQTLFTTLYALDEYLKLNIEPERRSKIKGLKIDLDSYKNSIINVNKKRGEYVSYIEEIEQMKKLGISNNE